MKSCLLIMLLLIFIPLIWWGYRKYTTYLDCENCQKTLSKYYFHFKNWDKTEYYILDCFCNRKTILKKVNNIRKEIMSAKKTDFTLLKDDFFASNEKGNWGSYGGSHDDVPWEEVDYSLTVAHFARDTTNFKRLSYIWFGMKNDTLFDKKVQHKTFNKSLSRVVYNVDYEELNRSVLNEFAQTVFKDSTRFKYPTCVYHLYNRQNKTVEATMKYEDNGKGFYFEIW